MLELMHFFLVHCPALLTGKPEVEEPLLPGYNAWLLQELRQEGEGS